ncbi:Heparan-alpha-glucosaminide N-acetyltransferase [Linum grandiflorum]
MALSTAGYGQVPFNDEEMQKPSYRPPSPFDDGGDGDSAHLLRSFKKTKRLASLDAFRGLCVFLMMVVDYGGSVIPIIGHSPWNGLHLADFVMPFFLFVVGVSIALVYKKAPNKTEATWKAAGRAAKLFLLGVLLQGGFLHGLNSLTYGVDVEKIRLLGILQRISIGYIVGAVCEIWLSRRTRREIGILKSYYWHWVAAFALIAVYLGLLYGMYVPDWQFVHDANVNCSVRGDVGPACNSAGLIDRYVLGINHLSITAAVTCLIGLQYGHVLAHLQDHKGRLENWCGFSVFLLVLGLFLALLGFPINKPLYSISYMLITSASAGITFCALYLLVDIYGYRWVTLPLEWMGKHALSIFIIVSSNLAVIAIQGFYWKSPENNLMNCIVSLFVHR